MGIYARFHLMKISFVKGEKSMKSTYFLYFAGYFVGNNLASHNSRPKPISELEINTLKYIHVKVYSKAS